MLLKIAPCPVIHSPEETPIGEPLRESPSRSAYFPVSMYKGYIREQDFIYINEGETRSWLYVNVLAHELGHALDYHGIHPAQHALPTSRSQNRRYRAELAGVSFEILACKELGMKGKRVKRWIQDSKDYLNEYKRGKCPKLPEVLKAVKGSVL